MDFEYDEKTQDLRKRVQDFMDAYIYPNEARFHEQIATGKPWTRPPLMDETKAKAREAEQVEVIRRLRLHELDGASLDRLISQAKR